VRDILLNLYINIFTQVLNHLSISSQVSIVDNLEHHLPHTQQMKTEAFKGYNLKQNQDNILNIK